MITSKELREEYQEQYDITKINSKERDIHYIEWLENVVIDQKTRFKQQRAEVVRLRTEINLQ